MAEWLILLATIWVCIFCICSIRRQVGVTLWLRKKTKEGRQNAWLQQDSSLLPCYPFKFTDDTMRCLSRSATPGSSWSQQKIRLSELALWSMFHFLGIFLSVSFLLRFLIYGWVGQEVAWRHPFCLMHGNFLIIVLHRQAPAPAMTLDVVYVA